MGSMKDLLDGLYQPGLTRNADPVTSRDAAKKDVTAKEMLVWRSAWRAGRSGVTAREAAADTGVDMQSVTPRFKPLREKGALGYLLDAEGKPVKRDGQLVHVALYAPPPE